MIEIILVRHGKTKGNQEKRFSGKRTDEPVCQEGLEMLEERTYEEVEAVYTSPMIRCRQTACMAYGEEQPVVIEELAECDFGILEGKNHGELSGNPEYELFLNENGRNGFPGGESISEFAERSVKGLSRVIADCVKQGYKKAACTVHGGTILALMNVLMKEQDNYYKWSVGNGDGFRLWIDEKKWQEGRYDEAVMDCPDHRIYS